MASFLPPTVQLSTDRATDGIRLGKIPLMFTQTLSTLVTTIPSMLVR